MKQSEQQHLWKTLPLQLSLCQLPWAEEEEEDDNEGLHCKAGLHCLLFRTLQDLTHIFWHPKTFQGLAKQVLYPLLLPVALSAALVGIATCTCFTSSARWKPQVQGESRAQGVVLGQELKSRIFTSWDKPLVKSEVSAAINARRVLPCLMPSEKQQGFTSEKRLWINLEVR